MGIVNCGREQRREECYPISRETRPRVIEGQALRGAVDVDKEYNKWCEAENVQG